MKKRNPAAVFFLSIITFGIYDLYWLVSTKNVMNQRVKDRVPTIAMLFLPWIVVAAGYILMFASGGSSTHTSSTSFYGDTTTTASSNPSNPGLLLVAIGLILVGFLLTFILNAIWFFRYSKAVNEYTNGKMSTAVTFLILYLVHLIGVALIQDTFNDMIDGGATPGNMAMAGGQPASMGQGFTPAAPTQPEPQTNPQPPMPAQPDQQPPTDPTQQPQ
jgi:hypothetical protein